MLNGNGYVQVRTKLRRPDNVSGKVGKVEVRVMTISERADVYERNLVREYQENGTPLSPATVRELRSAFIRGLMRGAK